VPVIEVRQLAKSFWIPSVRRDTVREHLLSGFRRRRFERLDVLRSVSFDVERGETVGLMGRNGSGKSTLLKLLCGIYRPDGGQLRVDAPITPILDLGVGWNPELDGIDNILLLGTVMGLSLREVRGSIADVLAFAGLERFARLPLKHYSTGMAARLAYAVAFHTVREVLVLDEVFAVGDAEFRERCEARYRELSARGHTVLLVSHDPNVIAAFCRRALLLEEGRIVLAGPGETVAAEYCRRLGGGGPS